MTYVITNKCLGERYGDCAQVCPVNCIYPGDYQDEVFMVIDPEDCIECGACLPACPIDAIVASESESPAWAAINAELAPQWKNNPPVETRPAGDPPRKAGNVLVN
ncbi:MAG: 4Fe-4S binding protein [Cyanobacteria bacterium NC_groundwater_1444_Ag_S-0.65um_54_12]|nr:4Fe-4S binding protein [Cyanobacteria bacterium NC_groundwater_1444_Ag_S-0.65um_54_12]